MDLEQLKSVRAPVATKLIAAFVLVAIPLGLMTFSFIQSSSLGIESGERERVGIAYNAGLRQVVMAVAQHRGMSSAYLNGDRSFKVRIDQKEVQIEELVAAQDQLTNDAADVMPVEAVWQQWKQDWLAYVPEALSQMPADNFADHTAFIDRLLQLNLDVGFQSDLTMEPSYYLMDIVTLKMLFWTESAGILRGLSSGIAARGSMTRQQEIRVLALITKLNELAKGIELSLDSAIANDPELQFLQEVGAGYSQANKGFLALVHRELIDTAVISVEPTFVFDQGTQAIAAGFLLYDEGAVALDTQVANRIDALWNERAIYLIFASVLALIAVAAVLYVSRSVASGVSDAVAVFKNIQAGRYTSKVPSGFNDEIGDLLDSLKVMQSDLRERIEDDRRKASDTLKIKQALDHASAAVMVSDAGQRITYVNDEARALLDSVAPRLACTFTGFDFANPIGQSLADFHHEPEGQLERLCTQTTSCQEDFRFDELVLQLVISPVMTSNVMVGTVVELNDRSEEIKALELERRRREEEKEMAIANDRIRQGLDHASAATLVTDANQCITYINEEARELLANLAPVLTTAFEEFDFANPLGQSLAQFHQDPQAQDERLGVLSERVEEEFRIDDLVLNVTFAPVISEEMLHGIVVELKDRSEEVRALELERQRRSEEKEAAIANGRIKEALDQVSAKVVVSNADDEIIYATESAMDMFAKNEQALSAALGGVDLRNLVGGHLSHLARDPIARLQQLSTLDSAVVEEQVIGPRTFRIVSSPILIDGQRTGTVVEWEDLTESLAVQESIHQVVTRASAGDLTERLAVKGEDRFTDNLAQGINTLMETNELVINDLLQVLGDLSEGRVDRRIERDYVGSFGQLKAFVNQTMDRLGQVVTDILNGSTALKVAAAEISAGNMNLSSRTEQQVQALSTTNRNVGEFSESAEQNSSHAMSSKELASSAKDEAEAGRVIATQVVTAMSEISDTSKNIGEIIGVIDEIAFQTNLLALNAAVEAARAGEHGKGFAVVASEVRMLAQRSALAAKDIRELITDSLGRVASGQDLVARSGESLQTIVGAIEKVDEMVGGIASASAEQTASLGTVREAVEQIDLITQQNATMVEEMAAASQGLDEQAAQLEQTINFFKLGDQRPALLAVDEAVNAHVH